MASYPYTVGPETVLGANGNFGNSGVAAVGNNEIVSLSVTNVEFSLFPPENYENIYFRLVDALNGEPLDSQTEVGTGFLPEIATASSGFLVTYSTLNDAPVPGENNATGGNLVGQLYASSGSPLGSPFVIVAGSTSPGPEPAQIVTGFGFALTGLADGNFAASYQLETLNLLSYGHYSAEITNYTSVISHTGSLITAFVIGNSVLPPVQFADGNLITANTDGVEEFTESGSLVASVTTSGNPVAMAALADGDFVIAEGSASLSPVSIDLFSPMAT